MVREAGIPSVPNTPERPSRARVMDTRLKVMMVVEASVAVLVLALAVLL
jgi:hypothetical protein